MLCLLSELIRWFLITRNLGYLVNQGLPPTSSILGFHLLGDNAAFILYPIALLYKTHSDVPTTHIAPHLSNRQIIKVINKNSDIDLINNNEFEYFIFDLQHLGRGISPELMVPKVEQLKKLQDFQLSYQHENVFLFKKVFKKNL